MQSVSWMPATCAQTASTSGGAAGASHALCACSSWARCAEILLTRSGERLSRSGANEKCIDVPQTSTEQISSSGKLVLQSQRRVKTSRVQTYNFRCAAGKCRLLARKLEATVDCQSLHA